MSGEPMNPKWKTYQEYLASPEWAAKRDAALEYAKHRCQLCYSPKKVEVHHRRYVEWGTEEPSDLTVLCRRCHTKFTFNISTRNRTTVKAKKTKRHRGVNRTFAEPKTQLEMRRAIEEHRKMQEQLNSTTEAYRRTHGFRHLADRS